ncbi:hypothetical protein GXP67_27165 [Rhodocytophaga rosea]|uniref:Uncharacterized protein n=1 Tax=Rhodocytophaga rosea TaxID=2704465 RepID=A0A6C0GR27_9BACT|nr:hypothetical protein [Rhodocytophaga rosea]QHT70063.1 hypothetical protein GXP67_27165 [Rhodocytophaga rosea]
MKHPINRIQSTPNSLLSGDSSLVLEDRMGRLTILFSNGLILFAGRNLIENEKQFTGDNLYQCRYCWGKYQYQNQILTVFKPLPVGYLNLPGSYPIDPLSYKIIDSKIINLSDSSDRIVMQKMKLSINPDHAWLAKKAQHN